MQLSRIAPSVAERITEHERIIGFRHILVHGYDVLDPEVVWGIVQSKLTILARETAALLNQYDQRS